MRVPFLPLTTSWSSPSHTALAFGPGAGMDVALPALHLPELPHGSRRLYLCSILGDDDDNSSSSSSNNKKRHTSEPAWNVADCLRQVPLDVVASSHLRGAEETADVIHRSAATAAISIDDDHDGDRRRQDNNNINNIPLRIVSPRLGTSDRYVTGLQQILRDFDTAHHVCVVQHQALLQDTSLWQELCVLQGAQSLSSGNSSNNAAMAGTTCCRIHVLDHQACDVLGDKWTLQMCNFCCAHNEWL